MKLNPQIASHRRAAILGRVAELQKKGMSYDQAWKTANAAPDMQEFVQEMNNPAVETTIAGGVRAGLMKSICSEAMSAAERALAAAGFLNMRGPILESELFAPLAGFFKTPNAEAQVDSIEALAVEAILVAVRAALSAAVDCLSRFLDSDDAQREIYRSAEFAPMVEFLEKATGEALRTGNSSGLILSSVICTANIASVESGQWAVIAPYGTFPSPDRRYTQKIDLSQGRKIVSGWKSITGHAARLFKNKMHRTGNEFSTPVWDGHPDQDGQRWPVAHQLAEITDLRAGSEGLEGKITWNSQGGTARTRGPLYPSAYWWHQPPSGSPPTVYPETLESVGLVPDPNIAGVPAWTANSAVPGAAVVADISTPNARGAALLDLVRRRMAKFGEDYTTAFGKCLRDPANAALVGAMEGAR